MAPENAVEKEIDYSYDALGNRVEQDVTIDGVTTTQRYAYDGWNPAKSSTPVGNENFDVIADLNGDNSLATRYVRGDRIDELLARIDGSGATDPAGVYWTITDRQNSIRAILDADGNLNDSIHYDGFGNIVSETDSTYGGRYKYTGREFDVETQLQYNRARYYDAATGRWISQDPMGFDAGDSNLYRYVHNSPTNAIDPSALQGVDNPREFYYYVDPINFNALLNRDGKLGYDITLKIGGTEIKSGEAQNQRLLGLGRKQSLGIMVDGTIRVPDGEKGKGKQSSVFDNTGTLSQQLLHIKDGGTTISRVMTIGTDLHKYKLTPQKDQNWMLYFETTQFKHGFAGPGFDPPQKSGTRMDSGKMDTTNAEQTFLKNMVGNAPNKKTGKYDFSPDLYVSYLYLDGPALKAKYKDLKGVRAALEGDPALSGLKNILTRMEKAKIDPLAFKGEVFLYQGMIYEPPGKTGFELFMPMPQPVVKKKGN